jgi:hypothetical protein
VVHGDGSNLKAEIDSFMVAESRAEKKAPPVAPAPAPASTNTDWLIDVRD